MYRPSTKPILFQIKHVKFIIYPSIFYKPYFVAFLSFPECYLPATDYGKTSRHFEKKAKSNSHWSVSQERRRILPNQNAGKSFSHLEIYTNYV